MSGARHPRIVIAGGGVAAVETVLALRALPGGATADVTVIAPGDHLTYRPLAVTGITERPAPRRYRLDAICADLGAALLRDALRDVEPDSRTAVTVGGARQPYDALVIATGAREERALVRAHTFFADHGSDSIRMLLRGAGADDASRLAFVVPAGVTWSLPLYELALTTASRAAAHGVESLELVIVTPEDAPLAIFQGAGSDAVAALLAEAGIEVLTSTYAHDYDGRTLALTPGSRTLAAERVIALPRLAGPAIGGVPCDQDGFVHADELGRVPGRDGVYAIGDAATFPLKQGGLAAQQADVAAALIARAAGADVPEPSGRPRLRAILFTGGDPLYLTATITGGESVASSASRDCPWWPPQKIAARHLAPYLADRPAVSA